MHTFRILIVILSVTLYPLSTMFAQINVYTHCSTLTSSEYANGSSFYAGCYELPSNYGQLYSTSSPKEIVAENHILLEEDVEFTAYGSGQADLRIEPSPYDVVAFVPDLSGIPKLSKLELGIKPTQDIVDQIQNFLNSTGTNELNPFMSDDIYIHAEFRNGNVTKLRDAFFTKDVERDISGFEDLYSDPLLCGPDEYNGSAYDTLGGGWTITESEFPFRIRFAPPKTGIWECDIRISIENGIQAIQLPTFTFKVVESNTKGYLKVDNNRRFFKRDGNSFIPLGLNYSWPGADTERGYPLFTPGWDLVSPAQYNDTTVPIAAYEAYLRKMDTLADYGANYFRMIMCPWSLDIEYEKLGDYSDRMHIAKEMDLILERATANDMMIHWNMMIHFIFKEELFDITSWDWKQHSADGSDLYCYRSDPNLLLEEPIEWFTNPLSKKYYKERLRYIVARWGYSPTIAAFEHFSEIDEIGDDGYVEEGHQQEIASWHAEMTNYLKNSLHVEQLVSPSYTRDVDDALSAPEQTDSSNNDYTFSLDSIDMVNYNNYDEGAHHDGDDYPKSFNFFATYKNDADEIVYNRPIYDVMNNSTNGLFDPNFAVGRGEYLKPVMYSESGNIPLWDCDEKGIEIKREIYKSVFSGLAGYLEWELQRKDYYFDFRPLKSFLNGIDYESLELHPGFVQLENDEWTAEQSYINKATGNNADLTYLRSKDKSMAIGVITNRTYNYITKGGCYTPYYTDDDGNYFGSINNGEVESDIFVNILTEFVLTDMDNNFYEIEYYDADNTPFGYSSIGQGKQVIVKPPLLDENNWMILFKAERIDSKSLGENSSDSFLNSSIKDKSIVLYPIPAKEKVIIESTKEIKHLQVIDGMGSEVLDTRDVKGRETRRTEMNLSSLNPGVYNIKIYFSDGSVSVEKFIKL